MDNEDCNCSVEESIALLEKQVNKLESVARNNYEQLQSLRIENLPGSGADTEVRNHREQLQSLCIENLPGSGADTAEREKLSMI
jgi:hypothetical protein